MLAASSRQLCVVPCVLWTLVPILPFNERAARKVHWFAWRLTNTVTINFVNFANFVNFVNFYHICGKFGEIRRLSAIFE